MPPPTRLFLALLLAALASGPAPAAELLSLQPRPEAEERLDPAYRAAVEALRMGRMEDAERLLREVIARRPRHELAEIGLADVAWSRGRPAEAEAHLRRAVEMAPGELRPAHAMALFLLRSARIEEATAAFRALAARFPDAVTPKVELAALLAARGDAAGGEAVLREAVARHPASLEARIGLVMNLLSRDRLDEARAQAAAAAAIAGQDPRPFLALAQVERRRGDRAAAVEAYGRAAALAPSLAIAHHAQGELLLEGGDADRALLAFGRAIEADPNLAPPRLGRALALQARRQLPQAERAYAEVLDRHPDDVIALNNLAWLLAEGRRDLDRAEGWARRAVRVAPDAMEPRSTLGWVLRARGDLAGAARETEEAIRMAEGRAHLWVQLATIRLERGQRAEARQAAERALALEPQNVQARALLARMG